MDSDQMAPEGIGVMENFRAMGASNSIGPQMDPNNVSPGTVSCRKVVETNQALAFPSFQILNEIFQTPIFAGSHDSQWTGSR